jgi:tRNA A-37 threonylcarbamoyl transferase component Bud32
MLQRLQSMTRSQIEFSFDISGKKGKEGTTFRAGEYAVKLFKSTKSKAKLVLEADLQNLAARYGVAPVVHYVSEKQKFIVMDALEETIVDKGRRENWTSLPDKYAAQLYALCKRLDAGGVVQNDGNPLNLMLDGNGRLYIIDYGFAKKIDKKVIKKRGPQPNVNLTLWHFCRQLRHYGFENSLKERIVDVYMKDNSFVDQKLLKDGELLLGPIGSSSAVVVRKKKPPPVVRKKPSPAVQQTPMVRKKKPVPVARKKPVPVARKKPVPVARKKKKKNRAIPESDESDSDDPDESSDSDWVPYSESDDESDEERVEVARRSSTPRKSFKGPRYVQHVNKGTLEERIQARAKSFKKYKLSKD